MPAAPANRPAALALLGLGSGATRTQIVTAYRRLARASHPDRCPDPGAAERFAALTAAYRYAIQSNEERDASVTDADAPVTDADAPVTHAEPPVRLVERLRGHTDSAPLVAGPVRFVPWTAANPPYRREG